jgi:hypothetical protein
MTAEDHLQIAVADMLDVLAERHGFIWLHSPNEGGLRLPVQVCRKRKRMGVKAGCPDIILMKRGGQVVQIELKTAKGRMNSNQKAWQRRSVELGIPYYICRSVEEVQAVLKAEKIVISEE